MSYLWPEMKKPSLDGGDPTSRSPFMESRLDETAVRACFCMGANVGSVASVAIF